MNKINDFVLMMLINKGRRQEALERNEAYQNEEGKKGRKTRRKIKRVGKREEGREGGQKEGRSAGREGGRQAGRQERIKEGWEDSY